MLVQIETPETAVYMVAGYAVIFTTMLIYLVSLIVRRRNMERDLRLLEELDEREG